MDKTYKLCRHCGMQYPETRVRGCKCDGETDALILVTGDVEKLDMKAWLERDIHAAKLVRDYIDKEAKRIVREQVKESICSMVKLQIENRQVELYAYIKEALQKALDDNKEAIIKELTSRFKECIRFDRDNY